MISRSPIQILWQDISVDSFSPLKQIATHYSFSVSNENCVFVVQHRAGEDYLLVIDLITNKTR
jgi:hypothetical protein